MKKYVVIIILIGVILGGVLLYNTIRIENENTKTFKDSGYILQSTQETEQTVERYYFNSSETYKTKYDQKVVFNDTEGEQITTDITNFIHYSDGSISSFVNGVLLDLDKVDEDPITYYNILANSVLEKSGEYYTIDNLDETLRFTNFLWKIDTGKYIVVSSSIKLVFGDEDIKEINGYVEIEYLDNEIVRIYNQEVTYQTISSDAYIELPNNVKLNLGKKIVSKDDVNLMSLENMVIDSDDNVTIVDLEDEEATDTTVDNTNSEVLETETTEGSSSTTNNSQQIYIDGTLGDGSSSSGNVGTGETSEETDVNTGEVTTAEVIASPSFNVESLEVSSTGVDVTITIEDEDSTLVSETNIYILENSTGKMVYQYEEALGIYYIDLSLSTLEPDSEYTLVAEASYTIDSVTYTKNFIYKIFRTSTLGLEIEKDVFTSDTLGIALLIDKDCEVKSVDVTLSDASGNLIQTITVPINITDTSADTKELIEFNNLSSNTEYIVSLTNILYDGQILGNVNIEEKTYKTLKQKPTISGTSYEIDKRNSNFVLSLDTVKDPDGGIQGYTFEIYDMRNTDTNSPVKTVESSSSQITLEVDGETIERGVGYTFKVIVEFYDNEKYYEYESEFSNVFTMDGVEFPSVRFESDTVTYEKIVGRIIIEDSGSAIDLSKNLTVTYTDSTGTINSFTASISSDSLVIPVNENGLRANETYRFAVYGTVNLQDGNDPIDECYIGGFVVQTDIPKDMVADFSVENDIENVFNVTLQLVPKEEDQGELEPSTLTGITISIYAGQTTSSTPLRTITLVDNNTAPYESDLKTQLWDNSISITPEFFNATNDDFKDKTYTITVTNAYDYTDYQNQLPIIENEYVIETSGYLPDLPTDQNNALTVIAVRNYTLGDEKYTDLNDETIVGYNVTAIYDNSEGYARSITYRVYSESGELIDEKKLTIEAGDDIPSCTFNVDYGTNNNTNDTTDDIMRRGNSYYFTYVMMLDIYGTGDEADYIEYPYNDDKDDDEKIVLRSTTQTPQKQAPVIYMYPATSSSTSITFNYQFTDVDYVTVSEGNYTVVYAYIGENMKAATMMYTTADNEFSTITFGANSSIVDDDLTEGKLSLTYYGKLVKSNEQTSYTILSQYFEGTNSIDGLTYSVTPGDNKISIYFTDSNNALSHVTGVKIELVAQDGSDTKVEKDFQTISNNMISINYNELGDLLQKSTKVNVYAYYDTGVVGYDINSAYVTYQQAYQTSSDQVYYYAINSSGNLILDTEAMENMYAASMASNVLSLTNPITDLDTRVELTLSSEGYLYQGDVILQKEIKLEEVTCSGNDTIEFDKIIPGISLLDENGEWQISSELDKVTIKADLLVDDSANIDDNKIHIELYQTDSEYATETLLYTYSYDVGDFDYPIEINDLSPQMYYFIKFYTMLIDDYGIPEKLYLYDLDYQVSGRSYYFSTLANVGIDNIQVSYNPKKYEEKYISISYTLERTSGYDRIEYKLYHWVNGEYEEVLVDITSTMTTRMFSSEMSEEIAINPGSDFVFGDTYKIEITPIAEYTDLNGEKQTLILGAQEYEFTFSALSNPTIAISGSREADNTIAFRITVYDDDRIIVGDSYTIEIYCGFEKITPAKYQDQTFSVEALGQKITIEDVSTTQSYTIVVQAQIDKNNTGEDYETYSKQYTVSATNEYGISVGTVTVSKNANNSAQMDLIFNNSYNLNQITTITYSIYNTNGYSQNGSADFVPILTAVSDESYYTFTISENLSGIGNYYIELQFLRNEEVIETLTIEYVYL